MALTGHTRHGDEANTTTTTRAHTHTHCTPYPTTPWCTVVNQDLVMYTQGVIHHSKFKDGDVGGVWKQLCKCAVFELGKSLPKHVKLSHTNKVSM